MDTLAIIKRIEVRLSEIGMSKAQFYKQSGISSASYSQWKTGLYNPSEAKLRSAAECLGISYDFLRNGEKNMPTEHGELLIDLSDVAIAFYGEFSELSDDDKETVMDMVRIMRERRKNKG